MKRFLEILFPALFFLIIIQIGSCTFDNEEELLEDYICDTTEVVYSDLNYIFSVCATCHNQTNTYRPGIEMDKYESVVSSFETGKVIPAINHTGPYKMPYELPKLTDCDLNKINAWINAGMPEN